MFCPSCGTQSPQDQKFCKNCGAAFQSASGAQAVPAPPPAPAVPPPPPAPFAQPPAPAAYGYPPAPTAYPPAPAAYPAPPPGYPAYPVAAPPARKGSAILTVIRILFLLVAVGYAAYYVYGKLHTVSIGANDVEFSGSATKAEATALGNALKTDGYFSDQGATVLLDKETSGTTISYVVKDGIWNQAGMMAKFDEVTREVASSVGGLPINVQLMNDAKDVEKTSSVGSVAFGNDTVVYEGSATQAEAQALGQKLQSLGFMTGKGVDVFLGKHPDGTTLAFVVSDGVWNDAGTVSSFEDLVRQAAPAIGGLPIRMLMLSTTQQKEKDVTVTAVPATAPAAAPPATN